MDHPEERRYFIFLCVFVLFGRFKTYHVWLVPPPLTCVCACVHTIIHSYGLDFSLCVSVVLVCFHFETKKEKKEKRNVLVMLISSLLICRWKSVFGEVFFLN